MRILGFMSGTSLDAVDMAVIETDGETITAFGPAGERKLSQATRALVERATADARSWGWDEPEPASFSPAAQAVAQEHLWAARGFLAEYDLNATDLDLVGFHGQTVWHEPPGRSRPQGRTVQLGEAHILARGLGLPVAFDFRTADVAAGGQGAPLAPIYHAARARASGLEPPLAVLNLGGVGNITLIGPDKELLAFDTGPANGMIDLWVQARTERRFDEGGALAAAGKISDSALRAYLEHPYFRGSGPKSLDRHEFDFAPVSDLSLEDGAATLTAFAAEAVALALRQAASAPSRLIVSGGGRLNPVLMEAIRQRVEAEVVDADSLGWRGDAIEAEAFAFLAARVMRGLPISFPGATGAPEPLTGGRIIDPSGRLLTPAAA